MHKTVGILCTIILVAVLAAANTRVVAVVHAGDLIEIEGGWTTRLAGITVPPPTHPVGWKAYDFTKRNLEGKRVGLFTRTRDNTAATIIYDDEGLPLATIKFGKDLATDIAALLLERGYAEVNREYLPEDCRHYLEIEREARKQGLGIWAGGSS